MKHIKGLDTLRAFAVFFVIIQHFGVWYDATSPSGIFITHVLIPDGTFGVDLFFVLSGFLITSILFNAKRSEEKTGRSLIIKNFFIRRALRIFPIYYLCLFVLFLLNYPDIRQNFWYFATYTSNILSHRTNAWNSFSHTWTLAVEEQFYLIWPWLIIFTKDKYIKYVLFGAVFIGVITTYIGSEVQKHMGSLLVFQNFDAFGIGGIYAWARLNNDRCRKFESLIKKLVVVPLAIYFFYWKIGPVIYGINVYYTYLSKIINGTIAIWLIILVINNKSVWVSKYILGSRLLNYIGKISYGIYLYHYVYLTFFFSPINTFLSTITANNPALNKIILDHHQNYWIHVSIMILIASISYERIEKPILSLKKRFAYNSKDEVPISISQTQ